MNRTELAARAYIGSLELIQQGQKARDTIEAETDRIFFAPWHQTIDEYIWLAKQLSDICSYFATQ